MSDPERAVALIVRDIDVATRWYRYVLGLRVESQNVGIDGVPIEVHLNRPAGPTLVLVASEIATPEADPGRTLNLTVSDDLDQVAARAAAIHDASRGIPDEWTHPQPQLLLRDPEGYDLVLRRTRASTHHRSHSEVQ
jgi:catechol 2,3-dioxygenase-like lactoylglutathione lyase family enzyme